MIKSIWQSLRQGLSTFNPTGVFQGLQDSIYSEDFLEEENIYEE